MTFKQRSTHCMTIKTISYMGIGSNKRSYNLNSLKNTFIPRKFKPLIVTKFTVFEHFFSKKILTISSLKSFVRSFDKFHLPTFKNIPPKQILVFETNLTVVEHLSSHHSHHSSYSRKAINRFLCSPPNLKALE